MTGDDTQLAVLLRKAQWMLDDAAHEIGCGRLSSSDRDQLAAALDELAGALRDYRTQYEATVDGEVQ